MNTQPSIAQTRLEQTLPSPAQSLPDGFAALQPFVATWGRLETAEARYLLRQQSRLCELQAFYDALAPRAEAALTHLDRFPYGTTLPDPEDTPFRLLLGLTEAARSVEIYHEPGVPAVDTPHHVTVNWNDGTY